MPVNRTYNNQQEELSALHSALRSVLADGRRADQTVGLILREHKKWSGIHKKDWAEAVYGILANWRRLWFLMGSEPKEHWNIATTRHLRELWLLLRTGSSDGHPDAREAKTLQKRLQQSTRSVALRDSWPDWLDALCAQAYGKEWSNLSHALHQPAPVFLRCNTLKTDRAHLLTRMAEEGLQATEVESHAVALVSPHAATQLIHSQAYRAGLFEVQDLHSQLVSPLLQVASGQTVVDFCAGEGGKTLHLACLMHNKGRLFAGDTAEWKLDRLRLRARRAGISNLQVVAPDESKRWKRMAGQCDAVLVDAPCSGLGSLRRHVDIKWQLTPGHLENLLREQQMILQQALRLLKPGGRLVYATCSILPQEGEQQIQTLLGEHPKLTLETQIRLHPTAHTGDGFYAAAILLVS